MKKIITGMKNYNFNKEKAMDVVKQHESLVVVTTYNILYTNDIVCSNVIEMMSELKKSTLYRNEVKMYANKVENERKKYESLINRLLADTSSFFADANDTFIADIQKHVDVLYYAIKNVFDKNSIENSSLIARMELMRTLCDFSCAQYKQRIEDLIKVDSKFKLFHIEYMHLETMNKYAFSMMRSLNIGKTINLNTKEVELAMDVLARKLSNADIIANSIKTD